MNVGKRAILYIARKWKKTLLIFMLLFVISMLVLSGLAIRDAGDKQTTELRKTTGTSFSVSRNTATGGWGSGKAGAYSTQEFLTDDILKSISSIDGIKGYNASIKSILCMSDENGKWLEKMNPVGHSDVDSQFYSFSCINSAYDSLFLSGALVMCDGSPIDTSVEDGIMISKEMADKENLKIGDTIQAVNDPTTDDKTVKMKIIGLFQVVTDKTDEKNNYNEASYYDYSSYAFISEGAMRQLTENYVDVGYSSADFYVTDPQQLESIIQEAQSMDDINWNNFAVKANDEVYERVAGTVSNIGSLISILIILVVVISVGIMILILSMWMRSRKREIGILLAVGISKPAILLQYVIETLFVSVIAFPAADLSSKQTAGVLGGLFGKAAGSILVTPQHFMIVVIGGMLLLTAAVLLSCIPVMRYQPKEILSQME